MKSIRFFLLLCFSLALNSCDFPTTSTTIPCGDATQLITAINNANQNPSVHAIINLTQGCSYELTSICNLIDGREGLPSISSHIVIKGNGATILRSENENTLQFRLFHIAESGDLTLNDLTLTNGYAGGEGPDFYLGYGGAILNFGHLEINNSVITMNHAGAAGAIFNAETGSMVITKSTISNNEGNIRGGILSNGEAVITQSTISENYYNGIWNDGNLTITNSTISGNGLNGIDNEGQLSLEFVTIANNDGGINSVSGTVTYKNTLFGPNTIKSCNMQQGGTNFFPQGVNMDTDGSCKATTVYPNSLQLAPLADNGGPTKTQALPAGSPAIDAATGECVLTDQRGIHRPQGPSCDLGAYEYNGEIPNPTSTMATIPTFTLTKMQTSTKTNIPTFTVSNALTLVSEVCAFTAKVNLWCRSGPGSLIYPQIDYFTPEQSALVIGFSPDGFFAQVEGANNHVPCYVSLDEQFGTLSGECSNLPVLVPPPTPTQTPSLTPSSTPPTLGCTVRQSGGAIICVSPCPAGAAPGETCNMP
jgi:hypothetical protein